MDETIYTMDIPEDNIQYLLPEDVLVIDDLKDYVVFDDYGIFDNDVNS